jgi:hypothetical protein
MSRQIPAAATCLIGALLYAARADAAGVLQLVADDDVDPPQAVVLGAIRRLVAAGKAHGPQLVLDELSRAGELRTLVADHLRAAVTSGADSSAVRHYASATVARALRDLVASMGDALLTSADTMAEEELIYLVEREAAHIADCAERLRQLRGDR